jgi:hypothetical protein
MPQVIPTPVRAAAASINATVTGWTRSIKFADRIGRLRGRRSARRRARPTRVVNARHPEIAVALAAGAGVQYVLDPVHGKRRRSVLRDKLVAAARRLARRGASEARYAQGKARDVAHDKTSTPSAPADDQTLADRVRT